LKRLVLDIGGTNTRICLVDETQSIILKDRVTFTGDAEAFSKCLKENCIRILRSEDTDDFVGLSVAGAYLNRERRLWIPNLFGSTLVSPFDLLAIDNDSLFVTNDRISGSIGEMFVGAAKGCRDFLYISIGTGVGIGIVSDGRVVSGSNGFAGSVGWLRFNEERIEDLVGGIGVSSSYEKLTGMRLSAAEIFDLAESGSSEAAEVVAVTAYYLGKLIACFTNSTNPELIVLSGSVGSRWKLLKDRAMEVIYKETSPMITIPEVRLSSLGEDAQILGTSILMQHKISI